MNDVATAVHLCVDALAEQDLDWDAEAHELDWTRWETLEHLANTLFSYASRFAVRTPPTQRKIAFDFRPDREDGPDNLIRADRDSGPDGLLQVVEACGGLLAATIEATPPDATAYHVFGNSTPDGFAAMAITEAFVHTCDVHTAFVAPEDLCDTALRRIFPDAPRDTPRWQTLLWATGRGDLPGRERLVTWRWRG